MLEYLDSNRKRMYLCNEMLLMRIRLIEDIISWKRKVKEVAEILWLSRQKVSKWKARYISMWAEWLIPKKPWPKKWTAWNKLDEETEDLVVKIWKEHKFEWPVKLSMRLEDEYWVYVEQTTVWRVLKRRRIRYHREYKRQKKKPKLYTLDTPWREIQLDTSFPFWYQRKFVIYSAIDDCTRIVRSKVYDAANLENSIDFVNWLREKSLIQIKAFRTDQWREFAKTFTEYLWELWIEHKMNAPYHPQHNWKVERLHRTMNIEEVQYRPYLIEINEANYYLRHREKQYNENRRHTWLWMWWKTPIQKLKEVSRVKTVVVI